MNLLHRLSVPAFFLPAAVACSSSIPLDGLGCPCATGYQCCDDVCVYDGDSCDGQGKKATRPSVDETDPNIDSPASARGFPLDPQIRVITTVDSPPTCLTSDADQIYFMDRKASIAGVAKVLAGEAASARSRLNVPTQTIPVCGIARDGNDLFATLFGSGTIAKLSVNKGSNVLAIGEKGFTFGALVTPSSIVVDETSVYVAERDSGVIKRFDKSALSYDAPSLAAAGTVLGQGGPQPHDLIADTTDLYWIDSAGIRRMSKQGGSITTLTSGDGTSIGQLKVADGALFWVAGGIFTMPLTGAPTVSRIHFIEQRARENWAKKRIRDEGASSSSSSSSSKTESPDDGDDIGTAKDPEVDEDYAASFFQPTAFTIHQGGIYFASNLHIYAGSLHGGDVARVFVYREVTTTATESPTTNATFLTIDSGQYLWATAGALLTRPR